MIISAFSDGAKKDKIAEFYDTYYPCSFLRGILTETREDERETQITFTVRQENVLSDEEILEKMKMKRADMTPTDFLNNTERGDL